MDKSIKIFYRRKTSLRKYWRSAFRWHQRNYPTIPLPDRKTKLPEFLARHFRWSYEWCIFESEWKWRHSSYTLGLAWQYLSGAFQGTQRVYCLHVPRMAPNWAGILSIFSWCTSTIHFSLSLFHGLKKYLSLFCPPPPPPSWVDNFTPPGARPIFYAITCKNL